MSTKSQTIFLPPLFRFLMEATAWTYFLFLAINSFGQSDLVNFVIFISILILSIALLATFNFPGDKKKEGLVNIPGWARILNEWFSGGLLSIIGAYLLFQEVGAVLQFVLILVVIVLDRKRYSWMLGFTDTAPDYVTVLREV
ncbi:MAG: hypothetical protein ACW98A_08460 [Candidatus Hodarchaeales archaeon]|jgi:hypothetical protein